MSSGPPPPSSPPPIPAPSGFSIKTNIRIPIWFIRHLVLTRNPETWSPEQWDFVLRYKKDLYVDVEQQKADAEKKRKAQIEQGAKPQPPPPVSQPE